MQVHWNHIAQKLVWSIFEYLCRWRHVPDPFRDPGKRGSRRTISSPLVFPSSVPGYSKQTLVLMLEVRGNQKKRGYSGRCDLSRLPGTHDCECKKLNCKPRLYGKQLVTCKGYPDPGQTLSTESPKIFEKRAGSFSARLFCSTVDTNKNFEHTHIMWRHFMFSKGIFII